MNEKIEKEKSRTLVPVCSVREEKESVILRVELPGVHKDDIDVRVENDQLTITGRRAHSTNEGTWLLRERFEGNFERTFTLDNTVNRENIEALYEKGVMKLTLKLRDEVKPRRIEINGN